MKVGVERSLSLGGATNGMATSMADLISNFVVLADINNKRKDNLSSGHRHLIMTPLERKPKLTKRKRFVNIRRSNIHINICLMLNIDNLLFGTVIYVTFCNSE